MASPVPTPPRRRMPLASHSQIPYAGRSFVRRPSRRSPRRRGRTAREQGGQARDERLHAERLSPGGPAGALEECLAVRIRDLARDEDHPGGEPRQLALEALEQGPPREAGEAGVPRKGAELLRCPGRG